MAKPFAVAIHGRIVSRHTTRRVAERAALKVLGAKSLDDCDRMMWECNVEGFYYRKPQAWRKEVKLTHAYVGRVRVFAGVYGFRREAK